MYLVSPMFTAKPISLRAFNNTSAFLSIVLISSPIKFTEKQNYKCRDNRKQIKFESMLETIGTQLRSFGHIKRHMRLSKNVQGWVLTGWRKRGRSKVIWIHGMIGRMSLGRHR